MCRVLVLPNAACCFGLLFGFFYVIPIWLDVVVPLALFLRHHFEIVFGAFTSTLFALQVGGAPFNEVPA